MWRWASYLMLARLRHSQDCTKYRLGRSAQVAPKVHGRGRTFPSCLLLRLGLMSLIQWLDAPSLPPAQCFLPTRTSNPHLSKLPKPGEGNLLRLRFCLDREVDGPFLTLSRHPGDYCCGSGRGGHQRALFWAVPGHEQERTAVCFGEFHY